MTTTQHHDRSDHQVKEEIVAELAWMPNIQADRIGVAINDGAVTLSGQVQSYPEKQAAVRSAFRVQGVTAVADEIEVHHSWAGRTDPDIARDAGKVLERTVMTPVGTVKAEVHNQHITLTGAVSWQYERDAIHRQMSLLPGVRMVNNHIVLTPPVHVSAASAKAKIADALRRNASIEADRITLDVSGDTITLNGTVATWSERAQAGHAAWGTPGVTHVQNNLHVTR